MIKLYYHKFSRASRVRWALEELGVDYELVPVDLRGDFDREALARVNPMVQVPAISDGDFSLSESGAICMYLADRFGRLAPEFGDAESRGEYYRWMFFAMTELDRMVLEVFLQTRMYPPEKRNALVESDARVEFGRRARVLAGRLQGRSYLVGEEFSMADLLVASILGWARSQGLLEEFPELVSYQEAMEGRPAALRAQAD